MIDGSSHVIACNAPYAQGGLSHTLLTLVEEARAAGSLTRYFCAAARAGDAAGVSVPLAGVRRLMAAPGARDGYRWHEWITGELFDRHVARRLEAGDVFIGVAGHALHSMRRARALGYRRVLLASPTSHVDHVARQHARARRRNPIEPSWLAPALQRKTLREYAVADEILVLSEYARATFLAAGVAPQKLRRQHLPLSSRWAPPTRSIPRSGYHLLYAGRLVVPKGICVLMEAFDALAGTGTHLTLMGGFATRAMQAHVERWAAQRPTVTLAAGDPLPYLHRADVFVHPSWEDGLGLAPLEALACAVPVVVTEDTGMKEFVSNGRNGFVVPTGDVATLIARLEAIRASPLLGTFAPVIVAA